VILFSDDPELDLGYLEAALAEGRLSQGARRRRRHRGSWRLKAKLGLAQAPATMPARKERRHGRGTAPMRPHVARRAPTLVKDVQGMLPLDPERSTGACSSISGGIVFPFTDEPLPFALPDMLRERGFLADAGGPETWCRTPEKYDLVLYHLR
jgi:beta-N-acetylhexosaminidase